MKLSRRKLLIGVAGAAGAVAIGGRALVQLPQSAVPADFRVANGRIRQSVMGWCFKPMSAVELARHSREIGLVGMEGISPQDYSAVRELGLAISLVSSHGFARAVQPGQSRVLRHQAPRRHRSGGRGRLLERHHVYRHARAGNRR